MLIVKKFGGTSVANKERIYNVANRCVEEYKKLQLYIYEEITGKYAFMPMYNLMIKPSLKTIDMLGNIEFFDTENRKLIKDRRMMEYLKKPNILIDDFINSDWRIGYLKNNFKIFNNYDKIVKCIYKILKK